MTDMKSPQDKAHEKPAACGEAECGICGAWFTVTGQRQKYCPDCRVHPERKMRQMEREYARSRREHGTGAKPEVFRKTCAECGKEFGTVSTGARFCSVKCRERHAAETAVCTCCGRNLMEMGIKASPYSRQRFCSEECRWLWNERQGNVVTCAVCGKRVIRRGGGEYCSKRCEEKAAKASGRPPEIVCPVCGRQHPEDEGRYCSEACMKKAYAGWLARRGKDGPERKEAREKAMAERERAHIGKNGLCASCRRPYPECERMQTDFRMSPEGAVFEGSIVIKCPKYVAPKKHGNKTKKGENHDREKHNQDEWHR